MKEKIKRSIKTIENSKKTHVHWLKYFEKYPQQEKNFQDTVHSANEQRKIIKDYDDVLYILNQKQKEEQMAEAINIIISKESTETPRFVEIEDDDGHSIRIGTRYTQNTRNDLIRIRITRKDIEDLRCEGGR